MTDDQIKLTRLVGKYLVKNNKVYNECKMPAVIYGCGTWKLIESLANNSKSCKDECKSNARNNSKTFNMDPEKIYLNRHHRFDEATKIEKRGIYSKEG